MNERPLSDAELDAIEAYCGAATEGPWKFWKDEYHADDVRVCQEEEGHCICCLALMGDQEDDKWTEATIRQWESDALFVARARTDIPRLVRELRAARKALKRIAKVSIYRNPRTGERPYCTYCGFYEPEHKDDCVVAIARAQVPEVKG